MGSRMVLLVVERAEEASRGREGTGEEREAEADRGASTGRAGAAATDTHWPVTQLGWSDKMEVKRTRQL